MADENQPRDSTTGPGLKPSSHNEPAEDESQNQSEVEGRDRDREVSDGRGDDDDDDDGDKKVSEGEGGGEEGSKDDQSSPAQIISPKLNDNNEQPTSSPSPSPSPASPPSHSHPTPTSNTETEDTTNDQPDPTGQREPSPRLIHTTPPLQEGLTRSPPFPNLASDPVPHHHQPLLNLQKRNLKKNLNRSSPSLRHSALLQQAPPPLPTSDDLSLDKLRLVDSSFRPDSASTRTSASIDNQINFSRPSSSNNQQRVSIDNLLEDLLHHQDDRPDSQSSILSDYFQDHQQQQPQPSSSSSDPTTPSPQPTQQQQPQQQQEFEHQQKHLSAPDDLQSLSAEKIHSETGHHLARFDSDPTNQQQQPQSKDHQSENDQTNSQIFESYQAISLDEKLDPSHQSQLAHNQSPSAQQQQQQRNPYQHHQNPSSSSVGSSLSYAQSNNPSRAGGPPGQAPYHPPNPNWHPQYYQACGGGVQHQQIPHHPHQPHPHYPHPSQMNGPHAQQPGYGLNYHVGPSGYGEQQYPIGFNQNPLSSPQVRHGGGGHIPGIHPQQQQPNQIGGHPNPGQPPQHHRLGPPRPGTSLSILSTSTSSSNLSLIPQQQQQQNSNSMRLSSNSAPPKTGPTITKASIDEYRNRIKSDPDPEAHFNYAKFLIEAAKKLASGGAAGDDKAIKRYRDNLLQESLKLIKKLATQGVGLGKPAYSEAQFFLANCLGNGSLGLQVDHEKAYNLYVQASKQNHGAASYRTAVCNELGAGTRKDFNRAMLFYRKASALGDTAGMYKLGMILLNGSLGQVKNPQEALLWLKRAAQQADEDNPHALHELAQLYESPPLITAPPKPNQKSQPAPIGYLVPKDEGYARELYTQAAQLGYPPSQNRLGACYEYGALNCPVDPLRSIGWYTKAAQKGDPESELALSGWYLTGSGNVLRQSDEEAYLWARRAASKGLAKAEYAVGYYSEVGIGVKADLEEAKRWYMRAATNKNKRAMQRLTELKKMGNQRPGKKQARPTRDEAASECILN